MARRWRRRGWRRNWRRKESGDPIEGIVAIFALGFIVYAFTHPAQAMIFVSVVVTAIIIFFVVRNAKRSKDLRRSIDDYHHAKASPSFQSFDNYPRQNQTTSITPYQMWRGKRAEWFVQKIAEKFPEDFIALGSLMLSEKGNIDQVIVGPTGVWTIEVKSHAGKITFNGHDLLRNGMPLHKLISKRLRWRLKEDLDRTWNS